MRLKVSPVDGHTASRGGISFDFEDKIEADKWVQMPDEGIIEIPPFGIKRLPFTVTVPLGTKPGEYVFGFLAAKEEQGKPEVVSTAEGATFNINVVSRVGISLIVTVPGEAPCSIQIKRIEEKVDFGKWKINLFIINTGDVPFKGSGIIEIFDKTNENIIETIPLKIGYFVRKDQIIYPIVTKLPPEGNYKLTIYLNSTNNPQCIANFTEEIQIGESLVSDYNQQATEIAASQPTLLVDTVQSTAAAIVIKDTSNETKQNFPWIIVFSVGIFIISLAILIYSQITLRSIKKP